MFQLNRINDASPETAHAAAAVVAGQVYLHGGLESRHSSRYPCQALWWFNPTTNYWRLLNDQGPRLSHHGAFVTEDRYVNFVGGWNGLQRTSTVHTFDTHKETWLDAPPVTGFPSGAGLSSHSVTPLTSGGALVIGRLGGVRTQRRNSAVMKLTGDHRRGFDYEMVEIGVESRGGHAAVAVGGRGCLVVGGRCDPHAKISTERLSLATTNNNTNRFLQPSADQSCSFASVTEKGELRGRARLASRRYHTAVADCGGRVLVHGGEAFERLLPSACDIRNDLVVCQSLTSSSSSLKLKKADRGTSPAAGNFASRDDDGNDRGHSLDSCNWYPIDLSISSPEQQAPHLSAHCCLPLNKTILFFAGFSDQWKMNKSTYQLKNCID